MMVHQQHQLSSHAIEGEKREPKPGISHDSDYYLLILQKKAKLAESMFSWQGFSMEMLWISLKSRKDSICHSILFHIMLCLMLNAWAHFWLIHSNELYSCHTSPSAVNNCLKKHGKCWDVFLAPSNCGKESIEFISPSALHLQIGHQALPIHGDFWLEF